MFKGLGDIAGMMKQAQQMGERMKELQEKLKNVRVSGQGGGGLVTVEMTGAQEVVAVKIDPGLIERGEQEMIEDLVVAATNAAAAQARQVHAEAMQEATGGLNVPGMDGMLEKLTGGQQ